MKSDLYPLKFEPILKEKIWGGKKLNSILHKRSDRPNIGESWEISDVDGDVSVVANGIFKGQSLKQLLQNHGEEILGEHNFKTFGTKFPLLVKFIDAKADLSIQLHPNDKLAAKRHNSFGKTEMWYVMQADQAAKLIVGFNQEMNKALYLKHLKNNTLIDILNVDPVKTGDSYFIDVGRVHAIGAGVLVAEIQQTSDITYRVYDWDRVDDQGNARELHNDLAIDAFDFDMPDDFRLSYATEANKSNVMVNCAYFKTSFVHVTQTLPKKNDKDSFFIYICVEGEAQIISDQGSETIKTGETLLMPAALKQYQLVSKNAKLLEVYV